MKKKRIVFIVYIIALIIASVAIETYIYNKKESLHSEMLKQIREAFPSDENGKKDYVEAMFFEHIDNIEYTEVQIPTPPENMDKYKKKQWENKFGGIKHLYKLNPVGWKMRGSMSATMMGNWKGLQTGIQEYRYFPYMIGVPEGIEFNEYIAKSILQRSLDHVYCSPKEYRKFDEEAHKPNDYFEMKYLHLNEDTIPQSTPYYNQTIGSDPIYENGKFTGYYWYGLHTIASCKVLIAWEKFYFQFPEEREGFNASIKDRTIYYGIFFSILTLLLVLILNKNKLNFRILKHTTKNLEDKFYCKYCGKIIDSNSEYCKYCGRKL